MNNRKAPALLESRDPPSQGMRKLPGRGEGGGFGPLRRMYRLPAVKAVLAPGEEVKEYAVLPSLPKWLKSRADLASPQPAGEDVMDANANNLNAVEAPAPRSGVEGKTPGEVRKCLVKHGWAALPILAHDDPNSKSPGKAPALNGWQRYAAFDGPLPSSDECEKWARITHAPGTGIGCGSMAGIDIDFSKDAETGARIRAVAEEVFGPTPFVRTGQSPKVMLLYGAAEPIPKRAFKRSDGSGDGIDIQGVGSQFVAYLSGCATWRLPVFLIAGSIPRLCLCERRVSGL